MILFANGWRNRRLMLALMAVPLVFAALVGSQFARARAAAEAYLFGYPLVIMDVTRLHAAATIGPENQLRRVRQFPDADFKGVVRPNVDTLYTAAFIDMDQGPWIFEMAPNSERYELMPFMDAWTNVFATPGTRTTGTGGGRFLLAGPRWQGAVPEGLTLLRSPTRLVWLIGRTQTNGEADYAQVHRLQDGLTLRPLQGSVPAGDWKPNATPPPPPPQQLRDMPTQAFFQRLAQLMADNPPAAADAPMVAQLAGLGVQPGQPLAWSPLDRATAALGRWLADRAVARELKKPRQLLRGWATPPANIGQFGTDYPVRAAVAMVGLGANLPADSLYPNAQVDADGQPLHGSHRYRIHFGAGQLPPVKAFWSVTAYGADDFLIANPLKRYALGDRDPLVRNADGSLTLWVQAEPPPEPQRANWLPVRPGEPFLLNARLYWPTEAALQGRWGMPAVERLP